MGDPFRPRSCLRNLHTASLNKETDTLYRRLRKRTDRNAVEQVQQQNYPNNASIETGHSKAISAVASAGTSAKQNPSSYT